MQPNATQTKTVRSLEQQQGPTVLRYSMISFWSVLLCSVAAASFADERLAVEEHRRYSASTLSASVLGLYHRDAAAQCTTSFVVLRAKISPECEGMCWLQTSTNNRATLTSRQPESGNRINQHRTSLVAQNLVQWNGSARQQDNTTLDIYCNEDSDCTAGPASLTLAVTLQGDQQGAYGTGCVKSVDTVISHTSRSAATAAKYQPYTDLEAKIWLMRLGIISSLAVIKKLC